MMRFPTALAAALAGLTLASCGGDDGEPIPSGRAERLEKLLQQAERQSADGRCGELHDTAADLQREARRLPDRVSADTRETIEDGAAHLRDLASTDCREREPEKQDTTTDDTTTEDTVPTTTPPPTTPTTAPPTTETQPPTTEPTTPEETTPTVPPTDPGGSGPDPNPDPDPGGGGNGGTPPGQEKKDKGKVKEDGGT